MILQSSSHLKMKEVFRLVAAASLLTSGGWAMVLPLKPFSPSQVIISPSVAKANWLRLGEDLSSAIEGGAEWLHFSVQDGRMVPKISLGSPLVKACREAFPNTVLDVKLGCIEPEHRIEEFVKAGANVLSVHPESTLQLAAVLQKISDAGTAAGVVLNPGTSVSTVEPVIQQCQVAVVMLVRTIHGCCQAMLSPALISHLRVCCLTAGKSRIRRSKVH
jgi:ribulose-phosphate 3-epimerase